MFRSMIVVIASVLGIMGAAAQSNPAQDLNNTMGIFANSAYRVLNPMVRGEAPYDQAKVDDAFAKLVAAAAKLPSQFPDSLRGQSNPDSKYFANDKIWESKADVVARATKLGQDLTELRSKVRSLDELKTAYTAFNNDCNGCHRVYRGRKS